MAVLDVHCLLTQIDHLLPTTDRRLQRRLCQQPVHDQREMVAHQSCEHVIHGSVQGNNATILANCRHSMQKSNQTQSQLTD
jgi:flagellar biosynthesis/type III secretory pathway protein FliH